MKKRFIVIESLGDGENHRYVTRAEDRTVALQEATRSCAKHNGKVEKIVPLTEEHELLYAIVCERLNMWNNIRKLELVTGQDYDDFGTCLDVICSGLDYPPSIVEHEVYARMLKNIEANG